VGEGALLGLFLTIAGIVDTLRTADFRFASTVALVVWVLLLAWFLTESYLAAPQPIPGDLKALGDRFVQTFGHPLVQRRADAPPIKARLRYVPHDQQLEILIAPNHGRTYPNLSDHKNNVEYDVERVLRLVGDPEFVSGELRVEGPWVVIPVRRTADLKEAGVK
jgi:hypothetical protein